MGRIFLSQNWIEGDHRLPIQMIGELKPEHCIHIKGAREHNLRNLELYIPRDRFVVITGVSGSGKSTLAFDTIYAEGYRKYIDSLSTRARQLLEQVRHPDVDFIHGLPPVIAIEQRTGANTNPRSTVATVTEISDYAALLWAVGGSAHCPKDGGNIRRNSLDDCLARLLREPEGSRVILLAPGLRARPAILREELPRLRQRGFQRIRIYGDIRELDEVNLIRSGSQEVDVDLVIDRLILKQNQRSRLADSLELAFREGSDRAVVLLGRNRADSWRELVLTQHLACERCGQDYEMITPRSFSYNHPDGACPTCGGLGRTMQFQEELIVPDKAKSVKNGAIKPWRFGSKRMIIRHNAILKQLAEQLPFDPNCPWQDLDAVTRRSIMRGTGERLFSFRLTGRRGKGELSKFSGVLDDLVQTRRDTSSDGLRARLMAFQVSSECHDCRGKRLNRESLSVLVGSRSYSDFMHLSIGEAHLFIRERQGEYGGTAKLSEVVSGLERRLRFLNEVGLGYLTLDRSSASLSGGEAQRVRLATQLGMGLVGVGYVLDEPTIGLHPYDNARLLKTFRELCDRGNAVIVVEHDEETIRSADYLIELGPGAGARGGRLIYTGTPEGILTQRQSPTGRFLSNVLQVGRNAESLLPTQGWLRVLGARCNNLRAIDVDFPVGLLSCVTGVSGSGKSSLVNDILARAAAMNLNRAKVIPGPHDGIEGLTYFERTVRVDQSPIGRSPRSNPATYVKLFDLLRALFAQCSLAKIRGYRSSRFSFNVRGGRCERCRGDGVIKLDMQFLTDVYTECPSCLGKRYNRETLEVRFKGCNIAEILDLTVGEALKFFRSQPKICQKLQTLQAVGLGYLRLGQPSNTLSGGEAQRIKLSLELSKKQRGDTLYILDEPTTGLHWSDVQKLLDLLFRLRDVGNTVIIIEHHQDVIRLADWIIDLGPGGGEAGGRLQFAGRCRDLLKLRGNHTADCLRAYLERRKEISAQS